MVRSVGCSRRKIHKERFIGHEGLLLAHPFDGFVGQVFCQMVALLRGLLRFHGNGSFIEGGKILIGLSAEESVKIFEAAARWPMPKRPHRTGFPNRHLVTLAELSRGV